MVDGVSGEAGMRNGLLSNVLENAAGCFCFPLLCFEHVLPSVPQTAQSTHLRRNYLGNHFSNIPK